MTDLGLLASILRTNAAKVAARTSIKPDEVAAAEDLANKLGKAAGLREQSPRIIAEAARNRRAAYALFIKAYGEVRSGVQFLRRREGDADSIAPFFATEPRFATATGMDSPREQAARDARADGWCAQRCRVDRNRE